VQLVEETQIYLFVFGVLTGAALRDAIRIVLVSAASLPLTTVVALVLAPGGSVLGNLSTGLWWYGTFLVGMLAGLAGVISWSLVSRRITISAPNSVAPVDLRGRDETTSRRF
jgi:hypothetical protein